MTPEERFERIERALVVTVELHQATDRALIKLAENIAEYAAHADVRMNEMQASIAQYVAHADARMRQMEANLDALIRIITAEHSNGQGKLGE